MAATCLRATDRAPSAAGRSATSRSSPVRVLALRIRSNEKTVIRAGYGLFYGVPYAGATRAVHQFRVPNLDAVGEQRGSDPSQHALQRSVPVRLRVSAGKFAGTAVGSRAESGKRAAFHARTLYNQQWNFSIQRSLATDMLLQVAYVGNKGTHLPWGGGGGSAGMNMLPPGYSSLGNQLLKLVDNPFFGIIPSGPLAQPQIQYGQLLLPFPAWQTVAADGMAIGNSEYQALQASYNEALLQGTEHHRRLYVVETHDRCRKRHLGRHGKRPQLLLRALRAFAEHLRCPAPLHFECRRGIALRQREDVRPQLEPRVDALLGGWQANGILTLASGQPLVFATASNNSYTFGGGQHPDVVGDPVLSSGKSIYQWFNTAAFAQPANFTSGNHVANLHRSSPGQDEEPGFLAVQELPHQGALPVCVPGRNFQPDEYAGFRRAGNDGQWSEFRYHHRTIERGPQCSAGAETDILVEASTVKLEGRSCA